jgi:Fe-S oxidoreductase
LQECPVNVDMATYKAEFLSHYYEGRLRPRSAYAMGLIPVWARLAATTNPMLANAVTQTPLLRGLAKAAAGIAPDRRIPLFAGETFKAWFSKRTGGSGVGPSLDESSTVLLWPDTFSNYFHPEIAIAAVEVLEAAGFRVRVPRQTLCCGRPLYDYGMLATARRWLLQIMETLRPEIEAGIPIVGLEPSCVAVFRDELPSLFPNDPLARKLSRQSLLLSEFLDQYAPDFQLPALHRKALVQGHCHQQAVMGMGSEESVLKRLGLEVTVLDSGCCGMAGSFGFEAGDHYAVSMKAGERALLPAVRAAEKECLIIADGFSCRTQIEQGTDRRALHLAEVLHLALRFGEGSAGDYPQRAYLPSKAPRAPWAMWAVAALAGAGLALLSGLLVSRRRSARRLRER